MGLVDGGIRCPSDILRILAKSESGRVISALLVSSILLFLFSFMQWASWYK